LRLDLIVTAFSQIQTPRLHLQFGMGLLKIIDLIAAVTGDRSVQQAERGGNCALFNAPAWVVIAQGQGRSAIDLPRQGSSIEVGATKT
jgi:hypothetical protein